MQNSRKCRCECKKLIHKGRCDDGFIWNPSTCKCKCDKSCNVGEYLDYVNCKCRKRLIDKLLEKIDEYIDGSKMVYNATLSDYGRVIIVLYAIRSIINHSVHNNYGH